jgi:hypothetical protein
MPWKREDRQHFLDRSEELRNVAYSCKVPENRKMLVNMAEYYESFAREIEARIWERDHSRAVEQAAATARTTFAKRSEPERVAQPNDGLRAVGREGRTGNHGSLAE